MTVLEREGYLAQPHTSAGRIPTDRGYRFFVDHFDAAAGLRARRSAGSSPTSSRSSVGAPGARGPAARDQPAARPGQHAHRGRRRPARRVGHGPQRAARQPAAVAGARAGHPVERRVEKCVLHLADDVDDATVAAAGALLDTQLAGSRWPTLPELRAGGRPGGRRACAARGARRARRARRARARRAALRRRRQPARGRAGRVPDTDQRGAPARAARAPGRGRVARARPARPGPHGPHRLREPARRAARLLDRRRAVPRRRRGRRHGRRARARRAWTTARRTPRSRPSPSSSDDVLS